MRPNESAAAKASALEDIVVGKINTNESQNKPATKSAMPPILLACRHTLSDDMVYPVRKPYRPFLGTIPSTIGMASTIMTAGTKNGFISPSDPGPAHWPCGNSNTLVVGQFE